MGRDIQQNYEDDLCYYANNRFRYSTMIMWRDWRRLLRDRRKCGRSPLAIFEGNKYGCIRPTHPYSISEDILNNLFIPTDSEMY